MGNKFQIFYLLVALTSTLISIIVAVKAWLIRKELLGNYNLFFYFFISEALFDVILGCFYFFGINNTLMMDVFSIIGFLLITFCFLKYLKFKTSRYFFIVLTVLVTFISMYALLDSTKANTLDLVQITLQSLVLIFISGIVLYNFSSSKEINMFHSPVFWFAIGTFIYSLIDCVVTSGTNFLMIKDETKMIQVWVISLVANITKMLCYLKGLNKIQKL